MCDCDVWQMKPFSDLSVLTSQSSTDDEPVVGRGHSQLPASRREAGYGSVTGGWQSGVGVGLPPPPQHHAPLRVLRGPQVSEVTNKKIF